MNTILDNDMVQIYVLSSYANNKLYIGSFKYKYLSMRMAQHKYYFRNTGKLKNNYSSAAVFEEDENAVQIERLHICNSEERKVYEQFYIDYFKELDGFEVVNVNNTSLYHKKKQKEYYQKNRDKKIKVASNYYHKNREMILAKLQNRRDQQKIADLKKQIKHSI